MEILEYFSDIAEQNGWHIVKFPNNVYRVESFFQLGIEPYQFEVSNHGEPVTLSTFADRVNSQYEYFDMSKEVYSRLDSDGYYKVDSNFGLGHVYENIKTVYKKLNELRCALYDKCEKVRKDIEFYNTHGIEERAAHALESVLNSEELSDGVIVDMMYALVRNVAKYAVSHNKSKTNHLARELFGGVFTEQELKHFDEPDGGEESETVLPAETVVELCSHCNNEIEMRWNVSTQGYKAFCPVCGERLMLCDECMHSGPDGEYVGKCDYCSETDTCQYNQPKEGK